MPKTSRRGCAPIYGDQATLWSRLNECEIKAAEKQELDRVLEARR